MNTAQQILQECQSVGLVLEIRAGRLKFGYPASFAIEKSRLVQIIERLKTHKAELIEALSSGGLQEPSQPLDQITQWKVKIAALPPTNNKDGAKLVKYSLAFLDSPLSLEAVSRGWDALSLFGIFNGQIQAAKRRHDAMGLIPSIAWSKIINPTLAKLELTIPEITEKQATLVFLNKGDLVGSRGFKKRKINSPDCSVFFWENELIYSQS